MTTTLIDMTGKQVGLLTVLGLVMKVQNGTLSKGARWHCRCQCGKKLIVYGYKLRGRDARKSCGCDRRVSMMLAKKPKRSARTIGQIEDLDDLVNW